MAQSNENGTTFTSDNNTTQITFKGDDSKNGNNKGLPKPLVARISLWTTRTDNGRKSIRGGGRDSGNDSDDSDDDDDGDDAEDDEYDMDLNENAQLEKRLELANLPEHAKQVASKEMLKLKRTPSFMAEYSITRSYLELIADLPWNQQTSELIDLKKCRRDLDNDHYGMQKLKERIIQYLAVVKLKQNSQTSSQTVAAAAATMGNRARSNQPILMFVGPPGTGKTSIAHSIANSIGRKFQRISLGGVSDQSAIRGHRRTYIAAMPGRIIQGIKQVGVNNPVFLLDEVDKMSAGTQGDPSGALLEVLDPEQNHTFTDHYLNVPFDLSRVLFIATANSIENIPAALIDRMEVIHLPGYTQEEKFNIARRHLVPKQVIDNGLKANMIVFKDDAINKIISHYTREAGLRTLERRIATICRGVAVQIVEGQTKVVAPSSSSSSPSPSGVLVGANGLPPVIIDAASLEHYLGPVIYDRESSRGLNVPGVAVGLAWTPTGGEITFVEAEIMQGAKRECLVLTGQLGSVMRESATLALNWIRAHFELYDALPKTLGRDLIDNTVHIHFPAGGVGKDGPSAGVTIVVALMSLFSNISIVPELAMTGEITLRGIVLKVGGVKEKVLAAHRYGMKRVILPMKNETDLNDLPSSVKDKMKFHFVSTIEEVIRIAFDGKLATGSNISPNFPMDPSRGLTSKL